MVSHEPGTMLPDSKLAPFFMPPASMVGGIESAIASPEARLLP